MKPFYFVTLTGKCIRYNYAMCVRVEGVGAKLAILYISDTWLTCPPLKANHSSLVMVANQSNKQTIYKTIWPTRTSYCAGFQLVWSWFRLIYHNFKSSFSKARSLETFEKIVKKIENIVNKTFLFPLKTFFFHCMTIFQLSDCQSLTDWQFWQFCNLEYNEDVIFVWG